MHIVAELQPFDPVAGARVTVRVCSAELPWVTGLNDQTWWAAMTQPPAIGIRLFKGDFDGQILANGGQLSLSLQTLVKANANSRRFVWAGAPVKLYAGDEGQAWPWPQIMDATALLQSRDGPKLGLSLRVNTTAFEGDALTLKYAGTGGVEGAADLKDRPKPFLLGRCFNVEPVLIDAVYNVYQLNGYGPISAIPKLYERGSEFLSADADYPTYAALIAATIPNGEWATCLELGLFRLAAPAYGVITADVDGDSFGATWRSKTGEICQRILSNAGVSTGLIDTDSFDALDDDLATLPSQGMIGVYITNQNDCLSLISSLCAPCNAQVGVSLLGKLFVTRIAIGTPTITLDVQKRQLPNVASSQEGTVTEPYSYLEFGYARSWRVHNEDEITLIDAPTPAPPPVTYYQEEGPVAESTIPNDRWVDTSDLRHEYVRGPDELVIGGEGFTFGGVTLTIPWFEVGDHTADNTIANVPLLDYSPPRTINCDAGGVPFTGQFPDRGSIQVMRNGVSIRSSGSTSYTIRASTNLIDAEVDNTTGSLTKGNWSVGGMSANSGLLEIDVTVDGNAIGTASIPFTKSIPTQVVTGATGVKSSTVYPNATVNNTTDVAITPVVRLTLASGESLRCSASIDYFIDDADGALRTATLTPQYSSDGTTGWTDFASGVTGSAAKGSRQIESLGDVIWVGAEAGHADISQTKSGLAVQDWYVRLVAKLNASGTTASFTGPVNWSAS